MQRQFVNVVLQGGGVRGVAYAGALAAIPAGIEIRGIGGSSAGAIAAALVAAGYRGDQLQQLLRSTHLVSLLDEIERKRFDYLSKVIREIEELWNTGLSFPKVLKWAILNRSLLAEIRSAWKAKGIHSTDGIRSWLDEKLEEKRFSDVCLHEDRSSTQELGGRQVPRIHDLRIVAADVNNRGFRVFDGLNDGSRLIADAVQASLSIPIFFQPFIEQDGTQLVDGGVLSNFPSFLFFKDPYPTVGLQLEDITAPEEDEELNTWNFVKSLFLTMLEAHDKERRQGPYFHSFTIDTHPVTSLKFDLNEADFQCLYNAGMAVGNGIRWKEISSNQPLAWSDDPEPERALALSLEQARKLYVGAMDRDVMPDELQQEIAYTARIEQDWSVAYRRELTQSVRGRKPLVFGHTIATVDPDLHDERFGKASIADINCDFVEKEGSGERPLTRLPAFNEVGQKGFVIVYGPPILPDAPARNFVLRMLIRREFQGTVDKGKTGCISYSLMPRAHQHHVKLTFRIEVDTRLPRLVVSSENLQISQQPNAVSEGRAAYFVHEAVAESDVGGELKFSIDVQKAEL